MERKGYIAYCGTPVYWLGAAGLRGFDTVQNFYVLRRECLERGILFEDPEFPPTGDWRRPKEFCNKPKFIVDGISRFDVEQGEVGDCWFVSALATLTTHDYKLDTVLCDDNSYDENYAGIFHFRFFQYGKWVDVVVDDRLPVKGYGQLVSISSKQPDEFWSSLLEKAYAKLHGSYDALVGGSPHEALEDLTGGIPEPISLKNPPEDLFEIMLKSCSRRALIGCAPKHESHLANIMKSVGLIQGHAYSITCVKEIELNNNQKLPMVRLRNPWGSGEWTGPWSDNSSEWKSISDEQKKKLGLTHETDGEFWMRYDDFLTYFGTLDICNLTTHTLEPKSGEYLNYIREDFNGEWIKGKTSGGCLGSDTFYLNPQYTLTVDETENMIKVGHCTILIELLQKNRRRLAGKSFIHPGIVIYDLKENQSAPLPNTHFLYTHPLYRTQSFINSRAITVRLKLKPGKYVIIPCTYSPVDAEFLLRVYTEMNWTGGDKDNFEKRSEDYNQHNSLTKCTYADVKEIEKIFKDVAGSQSEIGWQDLKKIMDSTIPKEYREAYQKSAYKNDGFSKDICRSIIGLFDTDRSRKINFQEFRKFYDEYTLWKSTFATYDVDLTHTLSSTEFLLALYNTDFIILEEVVEKLMYRFGTDDNVMLFEDFIFCLLKLKKVVTCIEEKATKNYGYKVKFTLNNWMKTLQYM